MTDIDDIIRESLKFSPQTSKELNNKMINEYSESLKKGKKSPKWTVALIVPAVIACISAGTYMAIDGGFFRDKTTIFGTVIGQTYENATDEIEVTSDYSDGKLHINLNLLKYDYIPYSLSEEMNLYDFSLINLSDNTVAEDIHSDYAVVNGNIVDIAVDFNAVADTEYKLTINSFISSRKADQPLEIKGNWETFFET
ncbi:MAG: hypothetical protein K2L10_04115 [Ruminococcus sp.]|nr:hypothetical protein [Ruminococcus sp.]